MFMFNITSISPLFFSFLLNDPTISPLSLCKFNSFECFIISFLGILSNKSSYVNKPVFCASVNNFGFFKDFSRKSFILTILKSSIRLFAFAGPIPYTCNNCVLISLSGLLTILSIGSR